MESSSQKTVFSVVRMALCCTGICLSVLFVAAPFSCKLTEEGIQVVSVDKTAPQIVSFDITQRSVLEMSCTEPMTLKDIAFRKVGAVESDSVTVSYDTTETMATLTLASPTEIGVQYELTGIVEDRNGNTLTFSLPFTGYNDNLPVVVLSEIRSQNDKQKVEYVELFVLKDGNTAGMEIISGMDGTDKKYRFPALSVKRGDYITVHYCKESEATEWCIDELTDKKAISPDVRPENSDESWDVWEIYGGTARRIAQYDVVLVTANNGNTIMDAVLFASESKDEWSKALQRELAAKAVAAGIWNTDSPSLVASNENSTANRTLSRQNIPVLQTMTVAVGHPIPTCAEDWFVVAHAAKAPGATPGLPNNTEPYGK